MMRFTSAGLLAVAFSTMLSGCGNRETITSGAIAPSTSVAQPVSELTPEPLTSQETTFNPAPGRYCYLLNNGILTTYLRFTLDDNNQLKGDARSSGQNKEDGRSTSYAQVFSGTLTADQTAVTLTTWMEAEVQDTRETWTLTSNTLQTKETVLNLADCQLVDPAFQDHAGLEAKDLLDGANNIQTQRVEFVPGTTYTVVTNSVVRGDRDVYLLGAGSGQQMSLTIEVLEDNAAAFDVISPSGYILAFSAVNETIRLPHTGDYQVVVGGNAAYSLAMSIR